MANLTDVRQRLSSLQIRLDAVNRAWTVDNYEELLGFYVEILPKLMEAERCTIFIVELGTERIWSKLGTDIREREIEAPKEDSLVGRAISSGQVIIENSLSQRPGFHQEVESQTGFHTRNLVCAPIRSLTGHGVTGPCKYSTGMTTRRLPKKMGSWSRKSPTTWPWPSRTSS